MAEPELKCRNCAATEPKDALEQEWMTLNEDPRCLARFCGTCEVPEPDNTRFFQRRECLECNQLNLLPIGSDMCLVCFVKKGVVELPELMDLGEFKVTVNRADGEKWSSPLEKLDVAIAEEQEKWKPKEVDEEEKVEVEVVEVEEVEEGVEEEESENEMVDRMILESGQRAAIVNGIPCSPIEVVVACLIPIGVAVLMFSGNN